MELYGQLPIRCDQPSWANGAFRATVTIGGDNFSMVAPTFEQAAQKLRDELPPFFAEADANRASGAFR